MNAVSVMFFFFFQAEDGIRDKLVTGVQTCALPIFPEALFYAKAGAISLLVDYPWVRPAPWRRGVPNFDKPELDHEIYIQAVVDIRRGIDLLLARKDVDPKRLAYVGHSYGAQWGAILSAVDERIKTAVLVRGGGEKSRKPPRNKGPEPVPVRKRGPARQN